MNVLMRQGIRFHSWLLKRSKGLKANMGGRVLLLTTTGAKSGQARETPLMFLPHEEGVLVAASAAGAPKNPGWYHNVRKTPEVTIVLDGAVKTATARITSGDERDVLWQQFLGLDKRFAGYEAKTDRTIPVVVLQVAGD